MLFQDTGMFVKHSEGSVHQAAQAPGVPGSNQMVDLVLQEID